MKSIWENATRVVWVDADGCPKAALQHCLQAGNRWNVSVISVSNFHHHHDSEHHLTVSDEPQAVDLAILNRLRKGDIVVTQDQGLAALALAKGGIALSVSGHLYQEEEIGLMLELRHEAARFRRGGGRTRGPSKRTKEEDSRFKDMIESLLRQSET